MAKEFSSKYDNEDRIRWEDWAPSLQERLYKLFTVVSAEADERQKADTILDGLIDKEIQNRKAEDEKVKKALNDEIAREDDEIKRLKQLVDIVISPGSKCVDKRIDNLMSVSDSDISGKTVKIDMTNSKLIADSDFRNVSVAVDEAELAYKKGTGGMIKLSEVFNNWYRFSHWDLNALLPFASPSGESTTFQKDSRTHWQNEGYTSSGVWSFDASRNAINKYIDWSPYCGFVSPTDYLTNYYLRCRMEFSDDDCFALIVGFMTDSEGVEHTLSCIRWGHHGGGEYGSNNYLRWLVVYDFGNPTQHIIWNGSNLIQNSGSGFIYTSVKRINSYFEFKTSDVNSYTDNEKYTYTWQLPSSCPSDMDATEFANISKMLSETNRVGFGAFSMSLTFLIDKQYEIFDNSDIYAFHTDEIWSYNETTSSWYVRTTISKEVPNYTFFYDAGDAEYFIRHTHGNWTQITT